MNTLLRKPLPSGNFLGKKAQQDTSRRRFLPIGAVKDGLRKHPLSYFDLRSKSPQSEGKEFIIGFVPTARIRREAACAYSGSSCGVMTQGITKTE